MTRTIPIHEFELAGSGKLLVSPTAAKDVVAVQGSVLGGSNYFSRELEVVPGFAAGLFDAGTKKKKKEVIRGALADRGISLGFGTSGDRTFFSGQCFPEDLPVLFKIAVECLTEADFPAQETEAARERMLGNISESKTDTGLQAGIALNRLIYNPEHLNYSTLLEEDERDLKKVSRQDLMGFRNMLGRGGLVLAVTGDVQPSLVRKAAENAFKTLGKGTTTVPQKQANAKPAAVGEQFVPIPDKTNIDVLLGAAVPFRKSDSAFRSLHLLSDMLGGGFASHLMQTLRERDGLTYGVYAGLRGFADDLDGYLRVWGAFSPELYEKSIEALRREIGTFFRKGITAEALAKKQEEITGSYLVGLSTAQGLAATLHQNAIDGRETSYLEEFPVLVRAVTLEEVLDTASKIPTDKLSFAASGTFPKGLTK